MIYYLSCGCEVKHPGAVRVKVGDPMYCPQHGHAHIETIGEKPKPEEAPELD